MFQNRFLYAALLMGLALSIPTVPAQATVMTEVSLDDMTRGADAIVRGTITRTGVRMQMEDGGLEPYTVSELRVSQWLSGGNAEHVVIRERGGEWHGGGHWIDGTPRYRAGEEVIVFLRRDPEDARSYRTYAMAQGKFVVLRGVLGSAGQVRRDLEGMSFAHWDEDGMQLRETDSEPVMALDTFLARIRGILGLYGVVGSDGAGSATSVGSAPATRSAMPAGGVR